jgi:hypothetical protein
VRATETENTCTTNSNNSSYNNNSSHDITRGGRQKDIGISVVMVRLSNKLTRSLKDDEDDRREEENEEEVHIEMQVTALTSSGSGTSSGDSYDLSDDEEHNSKNNNDSSNTRARPGHEQQPQLLSKVDPEANDVRRVDSEQLQQQQQLHPQQPPPKPDDEEETSCLPRPTRRQQGAFCMAFLPVAFFSFKMIPSVCHTLCLQDEGEMDAYFFTAAFLGGLGATLYNTSTPYWHARFIGGAIAAIGSLFTNWMLLSSATGNSGTSASSSSSSSSLSSSILAIALGVLGMIVGAMPGVVAYFIICIVSDECYLTNFFAEDYDFYDDEFERSSLTVPLASPLAYSGSSGHSDDEEFVFREPTV